jgi:LAGLIDADG endonuclease
MQAQHIDPAFGLWFSGFADGEACFGIYPHSKGHRATSWRCVFSITLRGDDRPILEEIESQTGIGPVRDRAPSPLSKGVPMVVLQTSKLRDVRLLAELFDLYPLRSKKARDYAIWREGVRCLAAISAARGRRPNGNTGAYGYGSLPEIAERLYASHRYQGARVPEPVVPYVDAQLQF